jgi:hypothetical protein
LREALARLLLLSSADVEPKPTGENSMERLPLTALAAAHFSVASESVATRRPNMKRIAFAALAAALLATIAFAESADRSAAPVAAELEREYLPSVNFKSDGFASGAFTVPPS